MKPTPLNGLIAATTTPFTADQSVDLDAIGPMIERLIETGVTGIYVCGSTGEGMSLTCEERKRVVEASIAAAQQRIKVIVQVGHNCLTDAVDLAKHAQSAGADIVSATCPSYFKIQDHDVLVDSMIPIAAATDLPFYYYHIPALTDSKVNIASFLGIADRIPNFVGMKYTTTTLFEYQHCLRSNDGRYDIVWGCDEMLLAALTAGAQAAIGSTYNIAAPLYRQIISAFQAGEISKASQLQYQSIEMIEILKQFSFHGTLKSVMSMLGMHGGPCRLPLTNLSADQATEIRDALQAIGFFDWCGHSTKNDWQPS